MKTFIQLLIIIQFLSCFNKYGFALHEEKVNIISSMEHLDYQLNKQNFISFEKKKKS